MLFILNGVRTDLTRRMSGLCTLTHFLVRSTTMNFRELNKLDAFMIWLSESLPFLRRRVWNGEVLLSPSQVPKAS